MIKGFKVKILPNSCQQKEIIKFCNASRFAYNWAIAIEKENYENGGRFISGYELTKMFTEYKNKPENSWLKEISGRATKISILNAATAYENFFKKNASLPKFKTKKRSKMKCATHEGTIRFTKDNVRLEKLGWVKLAQKNRIPFGENIKYSNPKIEYDGVDFWISVGVEIIDNQNNNHKTEAIGIDLGIKILGICSNEMKLFKPDIKKEKKKLKRLQRRASKHYKRMIEESKINNIGFYQLSKSNNLISLEKEIKKQHIRIKNILTTNIHEFTTKIIKLNPEAIVIEDLNVKEMLKNKHLSEKVKESKFNEIRRQLEYKCLWNNVRLVIADRWYASSKTCSCCGNKKKKLSLNERVFKCEFCGFELDRDLNAAINLKKLAYAI